MNGDRLRRLLVARTRADEAGAGLESVQVDDAAPPSTADVTGRVEEAAQRQLAGGLNVHPRDHRTALDVLLRTTARATRRLDNDPEALLDPEARKSVV